MEPLLEGLLRSLGGSAANFLEGCFGAILYGGFPLLEASARAPPPQPPSSPSRRVFLSREAGWKIVLELGQGKAYSRLHKKTDRFLSKTDSVGVGPFPLFQKQTVFLVKLKVWRWGPFPLFQNFRNRNFRPNRARPPPATSEKSSRSFLFSREAGWKIVLELGQGTAYSRLLSFAHGRFTPLGPRCSLLSAKQGDSLHRKVFRSGKSDPVQFKRGFI